MLRANHAVRIGLRAASRNPELAFGKALLDLLGSLLSALPVVLALALLFAAAGRGALLGGLERAAAAVPILTWPVAGALFAAAALSWTLSMIFWAGALPLLAADAEMDARPPAGNFLRLCAAGFPRTAGAGAVGSLLSFGFSTGAAFATLAALVAFAARPSAGVLLGLAALLSLAVFGGIALDLLARLMLVRAAALGDGTAASFATASRLLGARLGACFTVAGAFLLLELVVGAAFATFGGALDGEFDPGVALLSLAPRLGLAIAGAVVFAWLETGRQGAMAALAADAAGLIAAPPEPPPLRRIPAAWELRPPHGQTAALPERVVEALPVDEPVIEALPVDEPVIEALPVDEPVIEALPAVEPVIEALPVVEALPEPHSGAGANATPDSAKDAPMSAESDGASPSGRPPEKKS